MENADNCVNCNFVGKLWNCIQEINYWTWLWLIQETIVLYV